MSTSQLPSMRTRNLSSVSLSKVQGRGTFSPLLTTRRITCFPNQSEYESLMCKGEGPHFWGDEKPLVSQAAIRVPANRRRSRPCGLKRYSYYFLDKSSVCDVGHTRGSLSSRSRTATGACDQHHCNRSEARLVLRELALSKGGMMKTAESLREAKAMQIVESCGARPLGIQWGAGVIPDLFLFTDEHGSTVGVPLADISETAVRQKLLASKQRWKLKSILHNLQ